jgi:hypothetical protein
MIMDFEDTDIIRVQLIHPIQTYGTNIIADGSQIEVLDGGIVLTVRVGTRVFVPHTNVASLEAVSQERGEG